MADNFEVYYGASGLWTRIVLEGSINEVETILKGSLDQHSVSISDTVISKIVGLFKAGVDIASPSILEVASLVQSGDSVKFSSDIVRTTVVDRASLRSNFVSAEDFSLRVTDQADLRNVRVAGDSLVPVITETALAESIVTAQFEEAEFENADFMTSSPLYTVSIDLSPLSGTTDSLYTASAIVQSDTGITLDNLVIGTRRVGETYMDPSAGDFALIQNITIAANSQDTIPASSRTFPAGDYYAYVAWSVNGVWSRDLTTTVAFSTVSSDVGSQYAPTKSWVYDGVQATSPFGFATIQNSGSSYGPFVVNSPDSFFLKAAKFPVDNNTRWATSSDPSTVRRNELADGNPASIGTPEVGTRQVWAGTFWLPTTFTSQQYNSSTGGWLYFVQWHGGSSGPPMAIGVNNDSNPAALHIRCEGGGPIELGTIPSNRQETIDGVLCNRVDWEIDVTWSDSTATGRVQAWVNGIDKTNGQVARATMKPGNPSSIYIKQGGYGSALKDDGTPNPAFNIYQTGLRYGPTRESITAPSSYTILHIDDMSGANTASYGATPFVSPQDDDSFFVENGGYSITRANGILKNDSPTNFRMWTQKPYGGPGEDISIKYRVRATQITPDADAVIEGVKCIIKWVAPINPDQTANGARGIYPWLHPTTGENMSAGSMTYTPMNSGGRQEISKRPWGAATSDYIFPASREDGSYTVGTWLDIEITLEWLTNPNAVRMRCYKNGVLDLEWTDSAAPGRATSLGGEAFYWQCFPGLRADDSLFELDSFSITSFSAVVEPEPEPIGLYGASFSVDTQGFTLESANATNLRRSTSRDANGALAADAIAAGNIRVKSPHFAVAALSTVTVTYQVSHDDTVTRTLDPQVYETTSSGSYLNIRTTSGQSIPAGSTPTTVTRTYTLTHASTAAMRVVPQLLSVGAAGRTLYIHDVSVVLGKTSSITWQSAWDSGSTSTLNSWFVGNTGPRVQIDTANPILGPYTISTQADATALKGKLVNGTVNWSGSNITLEDCLIRSTGGRCINFTDPGTDPTGNVVRFVELDGQNHKTSTGLGGISYFVANVSNVKILRMGDDSMRWGNGNCVYEHIYIAEVRRWVTATDGTYSSATDPHTDGIQCVRGSGHRLRKSWVDLGVKDPNDTGALLIKADSAAITDMVIEQNYLNGGHYTAFVHDGGTATTTGVSFLNNRFGRDYGDGLWSFVPTTKTVTRNGNVWADTLAAVPLTEGPIL